MPSVPARQASRPALGLPGQTCGLAGPQRMKDCSLEHPTAGRAATQPALRKPRSAQRHRQRAETGSAGERHPGSVKTW